MVNTKAVRQALYQKLNVSAITSLLGSGSASLTHGVAPSSASYPLCVFGKQSGVNDMKVMGGEDAKNTVWLVKGVVRADSASGAEDIDKAANDLLHFGDLSITGADDMYLARESDVEYPEVKDGVKYWHVGGLYRLKAQDA